MTIYQACVDYASRRQYLGLGMVADLARMARAAHCTGIRLRVGSSSESNLFWQAAGFHCTRVIPARGRRQRDLNCYRTDLAATLWTPTVHQVTPSERVSDRSEYDRQRRLGVPQPSRWART